MRRHLATGDLFHDPAMLARMIAETLAELAQQRAAVVIQEAGERLPHVPPAPAHDLIGQAVARLVQAERNRRQT